MAEVVRQLHDVLVPASPAVQQLQDAHLDARLVVVRWVVLDDLDGHQLAGLQVSTLHHLAEGAGAQGVEYEEPVGRVVASEPSSDGIDTPSGEGSAGARRLVAVAATHFLPGGPPSTSLTASTRSFWALSRPELLAGAGSCVNTRRGTTAEQRNSLLHLPKVAGSEQDRRRTAWSWASAVSRSAQAGSLLGRRRALNRPQAPSRGSEPQVACASTDVPTATRPACAHRPVAGCLRRCHLPAVRRPGTRRGRPATPGPAGLARLQPAAPQSCRWGRSRWWRWPCCFLRAQCRPRRVVHAVTTTRISPVRQARARSAAAGTQSATGGRLSTWHRCRDCKRPPPVTRCGAQEH